MSDPFPRPASAAIGAAGRSVLRSAVVQTVAAAALVVAALPPSARAADPQALPSTVTGDLGLAAYSHRRPVPTDDRSTSLLPYAVLDYQRFFARLDTVGIKTVPLGTGWLEVALRINFDGFRPDPAALPGIGTRRDSVPLGLGTLQRTAYGAWLVNAFHDVGPSGGQLVEAIWTGRFKGAGFAIHPQAGIDWRSKAYVDYYYGVSPGEAAASGRIAAYAPGGAMSPLAGVLAEYELTNSMKLVGYLRRRWLPASVTDSPLVNRRTLDTAFIGVAWKFD